MVISFRELVKTAEVTGTSIVTVVKNWYMLETGNSHEQLEESTICLVKHMEKSYQERKYSCTKSLTGWVGQNGELLSKHTPKLLNQR